MSSADPITVECPDCAVPAGTMCTSAMNQSHAGRKRLADLRALEQGVCDLCGQWMVRGTVEDSPIDAWHPDLTDAAACPPMPDPASDWTGYAEAINRGQAAGHPGLEHFVSPDERHEVVNGEVMTLLGTGGPPRTLQELAQDLVDGSAGTPEEVAAGLSRALSNTVTEPLNTYGPVCPECANGKHQNCTVQTLVGDDVWVPCVCTHEA